MPEKNDRIVQFEKLNLLGKALYLTGGAVRLTATLIDRTLARAADVVVEAERAFRQGLDPNVEDAKILEEYERKE